MSNGLMSPDVPRATRDIVSLGTGGNNLEIKCAV